MSYNKTYEQRDYTAELEQPNLYAVESHEEWIRWQLEQEKNLQLCVTAVSRRPARGPRGPSCSFTPKPPGAVGRVADCRLVQLLQFNLPVLECSRLLAA